MSTPIGLVLDLDDREPVYIPWKQVTYALFGRNGVGKSRTLAAVTHLFHGGEGRRRAFDNQRSTCSVIVEAPLPGAPDSKGVVTDSAFLYLYTAEDLASAYRASHEAWG